MRSTLWKSSLALLMTSLLLLAGCGDDDYQEEDANNAGNNASNSGNNTTNSGNNSNNATNNSNNTTNNSNNTTNNSNNTTNNGGEACEEIEAEYSAYIEGYGSCNTDSDCRVVSLDCSVGLGSCFLFANQSVTQEEVAALEARYVEAGCSDGIDCDCAAPPDRLACEEGRCVPDTGPNACQGIEARYEQAVAEHKACADTSDCQVLSGQCGVGLGGCYAYVNTELTQDELRALGQEFSDEGCTEGVCDCDVARPVACVEGMCQPSDEQPPLQCEEVEAAYQALVNDNRGCEADDECQILYGQCGVGLGGCYEAVNQNVSQEDLNELASQHDPVECQSPVCDCAPLEYGVACVQGQCALTDDIIGPNQCEQVEQQYNALVNDNKGCQADDECQILYGQCGVGLGGCYEIVNQNVSQEDLNALAAQHDPVECISPVCSCTPPPERAACVENTCVADEGGGLCEDTAARFDAILADSRACDSDSDCQLLDNLCDSTLAGCWEAVNQSADVEQIYSLAESYVDDMCAPPIACDCFFSPTPTSYCEAGACALRFPDCGGIEAEYAALVDDNRACDTAADCQTLNGQCGVGLGGCYEAVNQGVSQEDLNALGGEFSRANCFAAVCDCAEAPAVDCVQGQCGFVER